MTHFHPDDIAAVCASNRDRLLETLAAIQALLRNTQITKETERK